VENFEGFGGQGTLMSKFAGIEIRDEMTFILAKRVFDTTIGASTQFLRPRETDLLYYPTNNKIFEITYVENKPIFYPLGTLPTYRLTCELFEYSNERFSTGIPEIDVIQTTFSTNLYDYAALVDANGHPILDHNGNVIVNNSYDFHAVDPQEDNDEIGETANNLLDWTETNPFSENWEDNL
jgi:hypothetical protein